MIYINQTIIGKKDRLTFIYCCVTDNVTQIHLRMSGTIVGASLQLPTIAGQY